MKASYSDTDVSAPREGGIELFTIGHSSMEESEFAGLLRDNSIEILIDVRSQPVSRASGSQVRIPR